MTEKCPYHADLERDLGRLQGALIFAEKSDTLTAKAVRDLEKKVNKIENKMSKFIGIATGVISITIVVKIAELIWPLLPSASASIGG